LKKPGFSRPKSIKSRGLIVTRALKAWARGLAANANAKRQASIGDRP
jgi:hypothetical protein